MTSKNKIFRDPIYGYISIPSEYCSDFIDTDIFQRLRRIEQTSMRVLYPSAHHDRFSHSIGVYHLGSIAFENLYLNSKDFFNFKPDQWELFKNTFLIACLMHDCGHSPFSHTFEHYYLFKREKEIREEIINYIAETNFPNDYDSSSPAAHEKISALILLSRYSEVIRKNNASPELAARMIMGCKYESSLSELDRFKNKLIALLNGTGIDVDSLDYIQRDSWASGVSNVNIDYHRLFTSLMIKPDPQDNLPKIVFKKHVLSVLENISIGRNFLYKWIYSHHKVMYEQYLLSTIVQHIDQITGGKFSKTIFSYDSFFSSQKFRNLQYFLPSDDDLIFTFKSFYSTDSSINELLSRQHRFKALWKTYFEYKEGPFGSVSEKNQMLIYSKLNKGALSEFYGDKILCLPSQPKLKGITSNEYFIEIGNDLIDASKATNLGNEVLKYFLIYVTEDLISRKEEVISKVLSLQS